MALEQAMTAAPLGLPEIERTVSALGAKVAAARAERGWSLAELARRAGVSPGAVHKIEKSGMTPTIASLMKIAAALGKSVAHFVEEDAAARPAVVVRGDFREHPFTSKLGLQLENLSGRYGGFALAGAEARVEPGATSGSEPMAHPGEELFVLLEGVMRFTVDRSVFDLDPGDSIHFRTDRPHSWANPGDRPALGHWFVVRSS